MTTMRIQPNLSRARVVLLICGVLSWVPATRLLAASFAQATAQKSQLDERQAAVKVFQSYVKLEEKQDYLDIYNLFSNRYMEQLKREEKVQNASDYERSRLSSEAQWSQFRIITIDSRDNGFRLLVEARAEESGVVENDRKFYYIVRDHGQWKIDRWGLVA